MRYSIADLERLSGIKAHTIRIWEQRYNVLTPNRTAGNTRYYDDDQLRRLLNISSLSDSGIKISELVALSETEFNILLEKQQEQLINKEDSGVEFFISQMISAGLDYNEAAFDKHFSATLLRFGIKNAYVGVIHPMLVRIGLMWGKAELCTAQEHFVSNLIRQKILAATDGLPFPEANKQCWLLFLPQEEDHETGLLFANYLIRLSGQKTIYLGNRVPLQSLRNTALSIKFDHLLFLFVSNRPVKEAELYLKELGKIFKQSKIHIAGNPKLISQLTLTPKINWVQSVNDLVKNYL